MRIKKACELLSVELVTDIQPTVLRFYERQGLIKPIRHKNKYRDYAESDVIKLSLVIMLKELGYSLAVADLVIRGDKDTVHMVKADLQKRKNQLNKYATLVLGRL